MSCPLLSKNICRKYHESSLICINFVRFISKFVWNASGIWWIGLDSRLPWTHNDFDLRVEEDEGGDASSKSVMYIGWAFFLWLSSFQLWLSSKRIQQKEARLRLAQFTPEDSSDGNVVTQVATERFITTLHWGSVQKWGGRGSNSRAQSGALLIKKS